MSLSRGDTPPTPQSSPSDSTSRSVAPSPTSGLSDRLSSNLNLNSSVSLNASPAPSSFHSYFNSSSTSLNSLSDFPQSSTSTSPNFSSGLSGIMEASPFTASSSSSSSSSHTTSSNRAKRKSEIVFTGRYKENYKSFAEFLKTYNDDWNNMKLSIGKVSESKEHYFDPTPDAQTYTAEFLASFWSDAANIEVIDRFQAQKNVGAKQPFNYPSCISFALVEHDTSLGPQLTCYISVSSIGANLKESNYVWEKVNDHVKKLNAKLSHDNSNNVETAHRLPPRYALLDLASPNFDKLLGISREKAQANPETKLTPPPRFSADKKCAEKGMISELLKLFFDRELNDKPEKQIEDTEIVDTEVIATVNCPFYPFAEDDYKKEEDLSPYLKSPRHYLMNEIPKGNIDTDMEEKDEVMKFLETDSKFIKYQLGEKTHFTPIIECCSNCQAQKNAVIYLYAAAVAYGKRQALKKEQSCKTDSLALLAVDINGSPIKSMITSPLKGLKPTPPQKKAKTEQDKPNNSNSDSSENSSSFPSWGVQFNSATTEGDTPPSTIEESSQDTAIQGEETEMKTLPRKSAFRKLFNNVPSSPPSIPRNLNSLFHDNALNQSSNHSNPFSIQMYQGSSMFVPAPTTTPPPPSQLNMLEELNRMADELDQSTQSHQKEKEYKDPNPFK